MGILFTMLVSGIATAQSLLGGSGRHAVTRSELETAASAAERTAAATRDGKLRERKLREAQIYRERLREGDFQPGHRIYLQVVSDSALTDTFTVRSDRKLLLPNLPEISLAGVLDSELQNFLTTQISKYVRNPSVRATGLLRLSVLGAVARPGFYSMPTDALVSDAVMMAGGPSSSADVSAAVVRRGAKVALDKDAVREAFRQGLTLSDVGLRPGDELQIPDNASNRWTKIVGAIGAVSGLVFSIIWLTRRI